MSGSQHNLDISKYNFDEVLELFDMNYNMNADDMKRAKKKVLMSHPDKSRLDQKYFLFYKKAYEFVVNYYNEKIKHEERSERKSTAYTPLENQDVGQEQVTDIIGKMKKKDFNTTFNNLFETNMSVKPDDSRNDWFRNGDAQYSNISNVTKDSMGKAFDQIKQHQGSLVRHTGVQMLNSVGGTNLYGDSDDVYATSDPFSKLQYDDLRKVHKDQTILNVSESDFDNMKKYKSTDHLAQERGSQDTAPLSSQESEGILKSQLSDYQQTITRKHHESNIKTMEYEKKNKNVIGRFLQLQS
jgi:hypothetical protein